MNHVSKNTPPSSRSFRATADRRVTFVIALLALMIGSVLPTHQACADHEVARENLPTSWQNDAELTDVFFLNREKGWAVGAQGVILRTVDGGVTWNEISQLERFNKNEVALEEKIRNLQAGRRTSTSGMTHQAERSLPIRCRFESVHFVDERHGWAAGGYRMPFMNRSRAVVMTTNDGGVTWKSVSGMIIPRIRKIHFNSRKSGWAVGDAGNLFTSGLYFTSDGGQSWSSDNNQRTNGWLTATRYENEQISVDAFGRLNYVEQRKSRLSVMVNFDDEQPISNLLMLDQKNGIAVGGKGSILRTSNSGRSWQPLNLGGAASTVSQIDFQTVALAGDKLWFAGNPGSCLVSIDLKTGVTDVVRTPIRTRINRIHFGDPQHGVAVGELGMIVNTTDGGKSWIVSRGENQTSAMMFVSGQAKQIPLSILAQYAVEENRICSTVVLSDSLGQFEAGRQAVERLGCSSSTCLQIDDPVQKLATIQVSPPNDAAKNSQLLERLVKQIRIAKPMVIVCTAQQEYRQNNTLGGKDQLANRANLVAEAIRLAADRSAFPEHQQIGLDRHQVSRYLTLDSLGEVSINSDRQLTRTGKRVVDVTGLSRALLGKRLLDEQPNRFQIQHLTELRRIRKNGDLLSGLSRSTPIPQRSIKDTRFANWRKSTEQAKKLKEFAQFEIHGANDAQVWRRQIDSYTLSFERDTASNWLMQLTELYLRDDKLELAAQTAQLLSTRWTDSPYSLPATIWLARYYASEELGQVEFQNNVRDGRLDQTGRPSKASRIANQFVTKPSRQVVGGMTEMTWEPIQKQTPAELRYGTPHVASTSLLDDVSEDSLEAKAPPLPVRKPAVLVQRLRIAAKFLSSAAQRDPDLGSSPWYRWTESQIGRRLGEYAPPTSTTINRLTALVKSNTLLSETTADQHRMEKEITSISKRELTLMGELPEEAVASAGSNSKIHRMRIDLSALSNRIDVGKTCLPIKSKPTLEGNLSEAFWQNLFDPSNGKNQVRFARDLEYLYVAVVCRKLPGVDYNWNRQPRPRDAELHRRDRVAFDLDVDRDYRSTFHFEVDHRGWVRDSCSNNANWNPDWYVSQSETDTTWTVEAAIPLKEIVAKQIPSTNQVTWAVKAARLTSEVSKDDQSEFQIKAFNADEFEFLNFNEE